jgi:hypothetical protein
MSFVCPGAAPEPKGVPPMNRSHATRHLALLLVVAALLAALNGGWSWDDVAVFIAL